jgi:hypothetical protein
MENNKNEPNTLSVNLTKPLQVPSREAIEIAARIMANRAMRELELKQQKTPNSKAKSE